MIRAVIIFFALAAIFLLGVWTRYLVTRNQRLEVQVHALEQALSEQKKENQKIYDQFLHEKTVLHSAALNGALQLKDVQDELDRETHQLQEAQKNLGALRQAKKGIPQTNFRAHIDEENVVLARLTDQLKALGSDSKAVNDRSTAYRDQTEQNILQQISDNQTQVDQTKAMIDQVQGQIQDVQQTRGDPYKAKKLETLRAQLAGLKNTRAQQDSLTRALHQQSRSNNQAISQEVHSEQNEVEQDRQRLNSQIKQVRADLVHWQELQKAQGNQAGDEQIHQAEQTVASHKQKIQDLQRTLGTLNQTVPSAELSH